MCQLQAQTLREPKASAWDWESTESLWRKPSLKHWEQEVEGLNEPSL